MPFEFKTRPMTAADVPACVEILNHTIAMGGTTAYEVPYSVEGFKDHYLDEPPVSNVVLFKGRVVGFQGAFDVSDATLSIGSFTDQRAPIKGAGRALFEVTKRDAKAKGFKRILAKITADNTPGLAYYSAIGFTDLEIKKGDATRGGVPIDRVIKVFDL